MFPFPPCRRLKEEEGVGGIVGHHSPVCLIGVDAQRRRGGGVRGVVFAAVVEPSGRRCRGEREFEGRRQRCGREGDCIVIIVEGEGGKGAGTLLSATSSSALTLSWMREVGRLGYGGTGGNDEGLERRRLRSSHRRHRRRAEWVQDLGERGERDDNNGERGRHVFIVVVDVDIDVVNSNPSCQAPSLPRA
jgi:hypothetical protein